MVAEARINFADDLDREKQTEVAMALHQAVEEGTLDNLNPILPLKMVIDGDEGDKFICLI